MKVLIIGGVAAGTKAAAKLKRMNPAADVTILTKGKDISYAGCGLPYYVGGLIPEKEQLIVNTPAKFTELTGAKVLVEREVTSLDASAKQLAAKNLRTGMEETYSYDECVIACGASSIVPPLQGVSLPGVFTMRTPDDAIELRDYVERTGAKRAVVAGGGFIGSTVMMAIRFGIARGLFTNESGLGSAPIVDAAAVTRNPVRQGLIAMTGVFWDTVIVCALTGLVLVSSILRNPDGMTGLSGGALSSAAFANIPVVGPIVLTVGLICFAWSTILGWSYYGERCWVYLCGQKAIMPFRIIYTLVVFVGSVMTLDAVWGIADILNACMAFPNLVALLGLSGVIAAETKKYLFNDNMDGWSDDEIPVVDK